MSRGAASANESSTGLSRVLDDACWDGATLKMGDVEFETDSREWSEWKHGRGRFLLMKPPRLLKAYAEFWRTRPMPRNVVELGTWEGGSPAFWFEAFAPEKHVAIDRLVREDSAHFSAYVESRNLGGRLKTYWGVDQGDRKALREIIAREFDGSIDLVIDDASHAYEPTWASFVTLVPMLRPGGLYIIEDWRWSYNDEPLPSFENVEPVAKLVSEAIDAVARGGESVRSVTALHEFAAIEKAGPRWRSGYSPLWRDAQGGRFLAPMSVEELRSFVLSRNGVRDASMVSALAYAGLRPSELLTLRWADIGKRSLRVGGATVKGVKQRTRRVHLLEPLAEDLALWREASETARKEALVFPPDRGARWDDDKWHAWRERVFGPAKRACGLESLTPLHLRYTFCALLLTEGIPIRSIAHQMGMTTKEIRESCEPLVGRLVNGFQLQSSAEKAIRLAREASPPG